MPKRKSHKKKRSAISVGAVFGEESDESDMGMEDDSGFLLDEGRADFLKELTFDNLDTKRKSPKTKTVQEAGLEESTSLRLKIKRKRELSDMEEDSEAEFESYPRASRWGKKEGDKLHYLLPLKAERGQLIHQEPTLLQSTASDTDSEEETVSNEGKGQNSVNADEREMEQSANESGAPPVLTTAALFAKRQEKLSEKKERIAELASLLIENPEENIDHLKQLRSMCSERDPNVAISVRKLAMVSLMTVIKDIAPSYRIRELTQSEKSVKVRKDVRKLRNFEQTLLHDYQLFLTLLDEAVKSGLGEEGESGSNEGRRKRRRERKRPLEVLDDDQILSNESLKSIGEVALQCLCDLIVALPHFNYRTNILAVLVPRMNSKALDGKVSQMCCATIEKVFQNDVVGEVSLEAVQLISKMVKAKSYKTKTVVLRTFLHLQLHSVDEPVSVSGQPPPPGHGLKGKSKEERKREMRPRMTKKQRRRMKAEAKLNQDMQETEAVESRERKNQLQTEIVKSVFLTYFRILKHSRHSPLLQAVLEGLAKFAHLINVDFFSDLMSILHSLAETGGLSNRECMQCVLTAFEILSGQGEVLNIDPRQFYTQLYGAILQLNACTSSQDVLLAVNCLDKMMRKRRQVSLQRVLGFVKRLATISLQLLPGACLAIMATIKKCIQLYSQCEQLLDADSAAGGGVFRPDVPDPEMCHASSTSLWELTLFKDHYNPTLRNYAAHLLAGAPSQGRGSLNAELSRKTPEELLNEFSLFNCTTRDPMLGVPSSPRNKASRSRKTKREYHYHSDDLRKREEAALQHADGVLEQLEDTRSSAS